MGKSVGKRREEKRREEGMRTREGELKMRDLAVEEGRL